MADGGHRGWRMIVWKSVFRENMAISGVDETQGAGSTRDECIP